MRNQDIPSPVPRDCWPDSRQTQLLKAALLEPEEAIHHWEAWIRDSDIDTLDYASTRMLPLLHHNLQKAGVRHPEMNRLKGMSRYHWCRNQILLRQLKAVLVLFEENGLPTMILKGSALVSRYYENAGLRPMSDVDLLVPFPRAAEAIELLQEDGWKAQFTSDLEMLRSSARHRIRNGTCFVNEEKTECDLHWALLHERAWDGADRAFWDRSLSIALQGRVPTRMLCPTDQLLHTCLHGGRYNEMPPMRWVADAVMVLRKDGADIDWPLLIETAKEVRMLRMLQATIRYLAEEFDAPIPGDTLTVLDESRISYREKMEYRFLTERVHRIPDLIVRDWFQHAKSKPDRGTGYLLVTFPAYLRQLWRIPTWRRFLPDLLKRLRYRLGWGSAPPSRQGA